MPSYTYECSEGHRLDKIHSYDYNETVRCAECGLEMWRRPSKVAGINWGGVAPSGGGMHPRVRQLVDTADQRRDEYIEQNETRKAKRAEKTKAERIAEKTPEKIWEKHRKAVE